MELVKSFALPVLFLLSLNKNAEAAGGYTYHRFHRESTKRFMMSESYIASLPPTDERKLMDYDTVAIDRYLRTYLTGPIDDVIMFLNYDMIVAYAGPAPQDTPDYNGLVTGGLLRIWAMFEMHTLEPCTLNAIHDFGQLALFSCPKPGIYRAYAFDDVWDAASNLPRPTLGLFGETPTMTWTSTTQLSPFDMMFGTLVGKFNRVPSPPRTPQERIQFILNEDADKLVNVRSDPVVVEKSVYCYYWMYRIVERARVGYIMNEVVPSVGINGSAYILLDIMIWIAEPSAVNLDETIEDLRTIRISDYSKLLTNRFSSIGLFPCLRKSHSVIEVLSEIQFVSDTDQNNPLNSAPHWRATIKIHSDRLISTLTDVTFTIASRQNTAYFHCFVGDTRVFIDMRRFEFVQRRKLERSSINLEYSNLWGVQKDLVKHQMKHVYGHGVQYIGYKWSKLFQPATSRTDMVIVSNPCVTQEFAFAVGGSLYVTEGLLEKGAEQTTKVYLPDFRNPTSRETDPRLFRDYLRVLDVAFTSTHFGILMADGYVVLHSSSISQKGIAKLTNVQKYQPAAFVKRRWCPRTSTPKLSTMTIPIFGRGGSIIVLQVYPTEGSVRMWVTPPSISCLGEGLGFVKVADEATTVINETEIHYNEYVAVNRSNQNTGIIERSYDPRPDPPAPPPINFEEAYTFLINGGVEVKDGSDPHYPPELTNPASRVISNDLTDFNQAVIYVLDEDKRRLTKTLLDNGITNVNSGTGSTKDDIGIYSVEFTAVEKQYIVAAKFSANEIPKDFGHGFKERPFQMMITTVTVTNFPFKIRTRYDYRTQDEVLDTIIPFPGIILMRTRAHVVPVVESRDPIENAEHQKDLAGATLVEYTPQIYTMNTAIPSYVIDFGDILVYKSIEGRYARPLHYYDWKAIQDQLKQGPPPPPLIFPKSQIIFAQTGRLFDLVVTEQGIISVLYRKMKRHIIQDDRNCIKTNDSIEHQTVVMGSVVSLEGLREARPFFRNDNVFQRATPDGEVIYGIYDVKPHSPFRSCQADRNTTASDIEICIEQATEPLISDGELIPVCSTDNIAPCRDVGYIPDCDPSIPQDDKHACLRPNNFTCGNRYVEKSFLQPEFVNLTSCDKVERTVAGCLPKYSPREELRSVNLLGTSFLSYLLGSIRTVKSLHPEAPEPQAGDPEEPETCPFSSFLLYNTDFDFAEVGVQTRISGEISYFGVDIPAEADLIIEYERNMGIVIEISSSSEEERGLTTIRKSVDIHFEMTDYTLHKLQSVGDDLNWGGVDLNFTATNYDDIRARENSTVFSITFRPSIVNLRCKHSDFFKTVQFNVGCNAFSQIRLLSEASPLKRINWTELTVINSDEFKWYRDTTGDMWNLTIPSAHIYHQQLKHDVFTCVKDRDDKTRKFCRIPYYKYFKDEVFTISYRDFFFPQFEQFLTVVSRRVSGNMIIYDLLGSKEFNLTVNKLDARCYSNGGLWYDKLLDTTKTINRGSSVHENIYTHYKDCFEASDESNREQPYQLYATPFYVHNLTNKNGFRFRRYRNQIFIFRAVLINTYFNRFTYCKLLETFFMVRITGIPIPRQGLALWHYIVVILIVTCFFFVSYASFYKFYTWKLDLGLQNDSFTQLRPEPEPGYLMNEYRSKSKSVDGGTTARKKGSKTGQVQQRESIPIGQKR